MTQIATVTAIPVPGIAVVTVARQTACGHDCENCGGCGAQAGILTVRARTKLQLTPGDRVEIYSDRRVLSIAALVYLAPVALFLACYLLPSALSEPLRYLCGGGGFALGLALAAGYDRRIRRSGGVAYEVTRRL